MVLESVGRREGRAEPGTVVEAGLAGSHAIRVLTLSKAPSRGGSLGPLACGPYGIHQVRRPPYGSGKLLSSSAAAVVSGYQRCPLAATFCTDEKQTHAEEVVSRRAGHSGAHCLGVLSGLCCLGADTRMVSHQSWLIARVRVPWPSAFPSYLNDQRWSN